MVKTFVISVGGSLIVPNEIDVLFLKSLKNLVIKNSEYRFIFVTGGGSTARRYIGAASKVTRLSDDDKDWLGIHSTRLNAHLFRTIFRGLAYERVLKNYEEKIRTNKRVIIASGWRPGHSTDYDAVQFAQLYKEKLVINLTNTDYVYDKDPAKFPDAKPFKDLTWKEYFKLVPRTWKPGMHAPFDVLASNFAAKHDITVVQINGRKIAELQNFLDRKSFVGTVIHS